MLIFVNPFFAVFGFTGYLFVQLIPGRWKARAAGMVINAALMAVSEVGGVDQLHGKGWIPYIGLFMVNVFIVGAMTKGAMDEDRRAEQRTRTIDQLSEANRQLEQMMEENAGLHAQLVAQARRGRGLRRAAADGGGDPRHARAGPDRDPRAARGGGAGRRRRSRRSRHLGLAKQLARDSLAEARRSVQALRPQKLEGARLPDAVRTLAEEWKQTSGIPVRVEVDGEAAPLQPALEVVLFRAAQEALANIAKHAQATRAGMTLSYMHDQVSLDVLDDGKGFEPRQVNGDGYGLAAMRQRLRQVGGGLEIESTPGDGTTVSASVPALRSNERPSEP